MMQRLLPFITLIVLFVALAIASPNFLTGTNLSSVVRQTAVINIMSLGMTIIIIAGGIDHVSPPSINKSNLRSTASPQPSPTTASSTAWSPPSPATRRSISSSTCSTG